MIALSLVVVAANMTVSNLNVIGDDGQATPVPEKVVEVIGKATLPFDGIGATVGYIVKDGTSYKIVRFDGGSMAAQTASPEFLTVYEADNGEIYTQPILVN